MRKTTSVAEVSLWRSPRKVVYGAVLSAMALGAWPQSVFAQCPPEEPPLAPVTEDFQSLALGGLATFANCWTSSPVSTSTSALGWRVEDGPPGSGSTGPQNDNTLGTSVGKYIHLETSGGSTGSTAELVTTDISLDNLSANRNLTFFYHMYGATTGTLAVQIFDGFVWTPLWSITGQQQTSRTAPWTEVIVPLNAYSGVIKIKFIGTRGSSFTGDMAIDDFKIDNAPLCAKPTLAAASNVGSSTADITWTVGDTTATSWEIQYGPAGFALGSGTTVTSGTNSVSLTGLSGYTSYVAYVREACASVAGYSDWSNAASFTTGVAAPWLYDFSYASFPPTGFSRATGQAANPTTFSSTASSNWGASSWLAAGSTGGARINLWSTGHFHWLITPTIDLGSSGNYEMLFDVGVVGYSSGTYAALGVDDTIRVMISTDNGLTWNRSNTIWSVNSGNQPTTASWVAQASLSGYTGLVKLAFYTQSTVSNADNYVYIDNLEIRVPPACAPVLGLSSAVAGATSVSASWNAGGSETQWRVAIVPSGDPAPSTGLLVSSTNYTFTGLTTGNSYDVYVRARCGTGGNQSVWRTSTITLTYCASTATNSADSKLANVTIGDTTIVSPVGTGNCATYTDYTAFGPFDLTYALPVSIGATYGSCGGNYGSYVKIYVDFNNDLSFDETTEVLAEGSVAAGAPFSTLAQMPGVEQHLGTTRMRVVMREGGSNALNTACGTYTYGETQDFTVNLLPAPACTPPTGIGSTQIYGAQATVRWQDNSAVGYEVNFDTTGFTQGSGNMASVTDTFAVLTGLSATTAYQYYVRSECAPGVYSQWAGPFAFTTTVSCPAPSNFVGTITSDEATITWQANGLATDVNYVFGTTGTTVATGTIMSSTGNSLLFSGLTPNTGYVLFVRDSCGAGDVSSWVGPVSFTTLCLPASMPYARNFNTWPPDCWNLAGGTQTVSQANSAYLMANFWSWSTGFAQAITEPINITDMARLRFRWSHSYNSSYPNDQMLVYVKHVDSTNWVTLVDLSGPAFNTPGAGNTTPAPDANFVVQQVDLDNSYVGQQVQFAMVFVSGFGPNVYVDDFEVFQRPPCEGPTALTASSITSGEAFIGWTANDTNSTSFFVEYGEAGFSQGTGTKMSTAVAGLNLTGLNANTNYSFYVRELCANGTDTSGVSGPFTFKTARAVPYVEDFATASSTSPGSDWSKAQGVLGATSTTLTASTSNWTSDGMANNGFAGAYRFNFSTFTAATQDWIMTPSLDFGAGGNYELRWQSALTGSGVTTASSLGADDTIFVVVSYDNGLTWNRSGILGTITAANQPGANSQFYTLSANGITGVVKFGMYARSTVVNAQSADFFVDNLEIRMVPTCPDITFGSLAVTNVAGTSATVSFASGVGPQYEVEYGPAGYTAGTGTSVVGADTVVSLTGLSSSTSYEVRVRQVCAGNDAGAWSFPVSFQTAIVPAWSEDFSGITIPPAGWSRASGLIGSTLGTSTSWLADGWLNNGTTGAIKRNLFGSNNHHWLITPSIELPVGVYNHKLDFDMAIVNWNTADKGTMDADDTVFVVVSTDNGATWNRSNILYYVAAGNQPDTTDWHVSLDLAAYAGNTVKIAWLASTLASGSDLDVMIDNVEIDINCSEDYNATANITGDYRVQFNWTAQPGVSNYRISWRTAGSNDSWNSATTSSTSRVVLNRAPGDYEFYISESNGNNPSCLGYFTVQCATGITFQYNVFQAPEMGQFGFVTVFGINGGQSLYDITLEYPDGTRELRENRNNFSFRSLAAGNYTIEVADNFGCAADNVGNFTIDALDTNYVPFLISAVNSSPNGYRPIWNRPRVNGVVSPGIINYQVRVQNVTDGTLVGLFTGITDTFRVVNNLTPGKTYRFNVRSRYNPGSGARNSAYSIGRNRNLGAGGNKEENGSDGVIALNDHMTVYPNPVAEMLYVNSSRSAEITLMDIAGNAIAGYKLMADQELGINMGTLAAGVYMLRVVDGDKVYNQRIIKK